MRLVTIFISLLVCIGLFPFREGAAQSTAELKVKKLAARQILTACPDCEITVESKWVPAMVAELDSSQVTGVQFSEAGLPRGYQSATVTWMAAGRTRNKKVQLFVTVKKKVPVANKRIERNKSISADDLTLKLVDFSRQRRLPLISREQIIGKSATRLIPKGSTLAATDLQQKPLVEAGDDIKMIYRTRGIEVSLNCAARQDRAKGEPLRVFCEETRKTYIATVLTPSKVLWEKTL